MKIYISHTVLSFNLNVGEGVRRIRFNPLSTGGGEFTSNDKEEQEALESHPFYGSMYKILQENCDIPSDIELVDIAGISKCADAKEYLKSKGVTATLKSKADIIEAAKAIGINFTELS